MITCFLDHYLWFHCRKTLSLTWVGWISSFLVLHLLYFTAAADSSVFTVRLLKMSLQLQGAQRWISYGRASAGRKTFTCRSRVGRTSGRQTKRQSAPANAALQSRWLSLTHKHTCVHTTSDTETECRADLTLMHSYLCETSSYHLPPQGHGLWLIITIQRVWAQFLSRLRDYLPVDVCAQLLCVLGVSEPLESPVKICEIERNVSLLAR